MLWKITAAIGIFCLLGNIIVGAVVLILATLIYMVEQKKVEKEHADMSAYAARKRAKMDATAMQQTPLPADGSMPQKQPGETDAAWAARVQAAEAAAFRAKTK